MAAAGSTGGGASKDARGEGASGDWRREPRTSAPTNQKETMAAVGSAGSGGVRLPSARRGGPSRTQFVNKLIYAREGAKDMMDRSCSDLPWPVSLEVDGKNIEIPEDTEGALDGAKKMPGCVYILPRDLLVSRMTRSNWMRRFTASVDDAAFIEELKDEKLARMDVDMRAEERHSFSVRF